MSWPVADNKAVFKINQVWAEDTKGNLQVTSLPLWKKMETFCARALSLQSMASMAYRQQVSKQARQSKLRGRQSLKMSTWATSKAQDGRRSVLWSLKG